MDKPIEMSLTQKKNCLKTNGGESIIGFRKFKKHQKAKNRKRSVRV